MAYVDTEKRRVTALKWVRANRTPERIEKDRVRAFTYSQSPKGKAIRKAWANSQTGKECYRNWHLKRSYGISWDQYARLLADQHGHCATCPIPYSEDKPLHVDHDHETGRIRGLLCTTCNTALGHAGDNIYRLWALVKYLWERG